MKNYLGLKLAQTFIQIDITGINIHDQMLDGSAKHIDR